MRRLIFGCGYLGERVACRWQDAGDEVIVVTRSGARAEEFQRRGWKEIVADVTNPESLNALPSVDAVLYAVGFDRSGDQSIMNVYARGLQNVLGALPTDTGRLIYISTTGVYGPAGGDWVDEDTPTDPRRGGGKASLAAEQALAADLLGGRSVILRMAGLYGPGRVPFIDDLRAGRPIAAPQFGFLNLIHVDDAAAVVVAATNLPAFDDGPRIYCISDGQPVERSKFYEEVARRIGAPLLQFTATDPNSPRAARAAANRRVRNTRMTQELNVALAHVDYRSGLRAILETQNQ
jgi:nucleoside-diphosphate-sugar epimerase